jgi:hypothetical protein
VQLLLLKIKVNADPAGPSQQPDQLKEFISKKQALLNLSPNNNLLTAPIHMETTDAMEDS